MSRKSHLYVLWTNADPITAGKMVFMYTINSLLKGWWKKVTLIIWGGATTKLVYEDETMQLLIKKSQEVGVHVSACKACADQLEATDTLEGLGIEVVYWGIPLTDILADDEKILTI